MVMQLQALFDLCSGMEQGKDKESSFCGIDMEAPSARGTWPSASEVLLPMDQGDLRPIPEKEIEAAMRSAPADMKPFEGGGFTMVRHLQQALGNHGQVDMMTSRFYDGDTVAVKRMPNRWVSIGPRDFDERYPLSPERPWCDLGVVKQLNLRGFPYACEMKGIFGDEENTYVVSSLATEGDLFSWCTRRPKPGGEREILMMPIVVQIFVAIKWLHELGIAHRDLSVENILMTDVGGGEMRIKIIDFGMSACYRICQGVRGKLAYQSPEMHAEVPYDAFIADAFQLGVVVFVMASRKHPWISTKPNSCRQFECFNAHGFDRYLQEMGWRGNDGETLAEVCSPALIDLMGGLLEVDPAKRTSIGESFYTGKARRSAWDQPYLQVVRGLVMDRWSQDGI